VVVSLVAVLQRELEKEVGAALTVEVQPAAPQAADPAAVPAFLLTPEAEQRLAALAEGRPPPQLVPLLLLPSLQKMVALADVAAVVLGPVIAATAAAAAAAAVAPAVLLGSLERTVTPYEPPWLPAEHHSQKWQQAAAWIMA
jgi:hypothetical protein